MAESADVPFKDYLDSQMAEVRRAVDVALSASKVEGVPLREYVEAILEEQKRALEMAEREREKAASALREEQYRANQTAEREREKAATALADQLARAIQEGDDRLREHIANQVMQIKAALESAERLELNRLEAALAQTHAVQRELELQQDASDKAIAKAEHANEKRFASVNEFREQLGTQTQTFLPREVAEAQFAEVRRAIAELTEKISRVL